MKFVPISPHLLLVVFTWVYRMIGNGLDFRDRHPYQQKIYSVCWTFRRKHSAVTTAMEYKGLELSPVHYSTTFRTSSFLCNLDSRKLSVAISRKLYLYKKWGTKDMHSSRKCKQDQRAWSDRAFRWPMGMGTLLIQGLAGTSLHGMYPRLDTYVGWQGRVLTEWCTEKCRLGPWNSTA